MCGRRLSGFLLFSVALLLLSPPLYSADFFPAERVYQITETELQELEAILTRQAQTIETLSSTLDDSQNRIERLSGSLTRQGQTIDALRTSLTLYEQEQTRRVRRASIRVGGITLGIGFVGGIVLTSWILN